MSVTDRERRHVFTKLEQVLGPEAAESMMQLLPFQSSTDLATRSDLNATTVLLQGQMAELRGDLTSEMAELRSDVSGEMAQIRGEMAALRGEIKGEFHRWVAVSAAANAIAVVTALIA